MPAALSRDGRDFVAAATVSDHVRARLRRLHCRGTTWPALRLNMPGRDRAVRLDSNAAPSQACALVLARLGGFL